MNLKLFRTLIGIGVCLLIAELTLLTLPQRGVLAPAGAGATQAQQVALPTGPASISGVVLRTHNRAPIESVEIQATFVGGSGGTATVLTDGSGRFTFKGIATGSYRVRAQRAGFFGPLASGGIAPMLNTQVVIQPAQPQATTEILLLEGAVVSGRVTDVNGRPAPNARVNLIRPRYVGTETEISFSSSGVTDSNGTYRIVGVEPGEHYLRAAVILNAAGEAIPSTVTYFPSGLDYSQGSLITASAGSELVADIQLVEGTRRRVSGRLTGADPATIGGIRFVLMPEGAASLNNLEGRAYQQGATGNGSFQLETMRPGVYDLIASTSTLAGRARVDLRDRDAGDITVTLAPTVELEIRFVGEGAASYTQGGFALAYIGMPLPATLRPTNGGFGARGQTTQTYTNLIQGKYSLVSSSNLRNNASYVSDIVQSGKSILDEGVITIGTEKPDPVEVRVASGGGAIRGTVQLPANIEAPVMVVAVPEGARRQNALLYARVQVRAGGRGPLGTTFRMSGMTPGRYKVFAFRGISASLAQQNPEFMKPYEQYGVAVDVSLSSRATDITVPLVPESPGR